MAIDAKILGFCSFLAAQCLVSGSGFLARFKAIQCFVAAAPPNIVK